MNILVTPYYKEKNEYRNKELKECLLRNLIVFDKIILVSESKMDDFTLVSNTEWVILSCRPTWSDMVRAANKFSSEGDMVVISNSDIYFDSIKTLESIDFNGNCIVLNRWDTKGSDYLRTAKEPKLWNSPDSQDVWIFGGKIKPVFGEFNFGFPGSDNRILHELYSAGYKIYNPSLDVKCYHLHSNKTPNKNKRVPEPYKTIMPHSMKGVPLKKKLNILHIGMRSYTAEYGLCDALERAGNYELIEWQLWHSEHEELNTKERKVNFFHEILKKSIDKDLIFIHIQRDGVINGGLLKLIKSINPNCKIVNFNGDVRLEVPEFMYDLGDYCITLYTNEHDVETMRKKGYDARYMNVGFDPKIYKPEGEKANCAPIVFLGNNYEDKQFPMSQFRYDMVVELKKEFGPDFAVYGNGWCDLGSGYLNAIEEAEVYRGCKAAINVSHFEYPRYSSDRLHRALGCGALVLNKIFPKQHLDFPVFNMISWNTIEELKENIDRILASDTKEYIILNTHREKTKEFAHKYLTWDYLINKLIHELDGEHKELPL